MKFIEKFFRNELAIDLGTVNTLIYQPGKGILLNEPSVVAIDRYDGEVVCVGHKALKLLGREPRGIEVHDQFAAARFSISKLRRKMLRSFIGKVTDGDRLRPFCSRHTRAPRLRSSNVRFAMRRTMPAGAASIWLTKDSRPDSAPGSRFDDERAHLVVDIGGGTTNIAIVASGGVVSSTSLTAGRQRDGRKHSRLRAFELLSADR